MKELSTQNTKADSSAAYFGRSLRRIRENKYASGRKFAEACGLSRETIRRYENGVSLPTDTAMHAMFTCLGIDVNRSNEATPLIAALYAARGERGTPNPVTMSPTPQLSSQVKVERLVDLFFEYVRSERSEDEAFRYFIQNRIKGILGD